MSAGPVDLIEGSPIDEVLRLDLLPAAETGDGDEIHVWERLGVAGRDGGVARSVVTLGRQILGRVGLQEA